MELASSRGALWALRVFFVGLFAFLYVPLIVLLVFSFNKGDVTFPLQGFTWSWYTRAAQNFPALVAALQRSAIVASITSVLAVALGVLASYALVRRVFRGKGAFAALVFSPLVIPYLVFGIALLVLFKMIDKVLITVPGHLHRRRHARGDRRSRRRGVALHDPDDPAAARTAERDNGGEGRAARPRRQPVEDVLAGDVPPVDAGARLGVLCYRVHPVVRRVHPSRRFSPAQQVTWPVFLFAQLRVSTNLPEMVAVSSVILVISVGLVVGAEFGRRRSEGRVAASAG